MPRPGRGGDRRSEKTFGRNRPKYEILCDKCGKKRATTRPDARFCSVACRKAAHRDKLRVERALADQREATAKALADNQAVAALKAKR